MKAVRTPEVALLKVDDVAAAQRCSRGTVYRHVREGDLRALRVGPSGPLRFRQADVEALLRPVHHEETR